MRHLERVKGDKHVEPINLTLETEPKIQKMSLQAHRVPAQGKRYSRKDTRNAVPMLWHVYYSSCCAFSWWGTRTHLPYNSSSTITGQLDHYLQMEEFVLKLLSVRQRCPHKQTLPKHIFVFFVCLFGVFWVVFVGVLFWLYLNEDIVFLWQLTFIQYNNWDISCWVLLQLHTFDPHTQWTVFWL